MGDFNSRVGKHPDSVCQEGNKIITNDFSESSLCATQRKSFDNDLNNHGKRILEICRSADLRILNVRINGDSLGRPTFHCKSGISVIDYSICDQDLLRNITSFIVKEPNSLSDHSPIILDNDSSNEAIINDSLTPLPKQFFWENDSSQKVRASLQSEDIQRMIHDFMNTTTITRNVDMNLDAVENIACVQTSPLPQKKSGEETSVNHRR